MDSDHNEPSSKARLEHDPAGLNLLHAVVTAAFLLFFLYESYWSAKHNPLWMDEVLATWVIRLPDAHAIWSAIQRGAEFSPPTYHLLLHALLPVNSATYTILRAPSVIAVLITGLCILVLLRRYVDLPSATFGMAWCLLSSVSTFGTQVRPYALLLACFAGALLLWDNLGKRKFNAASAIGLAALLALATSLHFYAVLFLPCFAAMELAWSAIHRHIRPLAWAAMIVAGLSSLLWLPLITTFSKLNSGDSSAPSYYAKPTFKALHDAFIGYYVFDHKQILFLMVTAGLIVLSQAYGRLPEFRRDSIKQPLADLYIIAFTTGAFPFLLYAFAVTITHTMNFRYGLITVIGASLLAGLLISKLPAFPRVASPALLVGCAIALNHSYPIGAETYSLVDFIAKTPGNEPIVIAEGYQYFQVVEAAKAKLAPRLVYLTSPQGAISPDPTNENQVKRWIPIRPDLHIEKALEFYRNHPHFYLLHTEASTDTITDPLLTKAVIRPVDHLDSAWLFEVQMQP